MVTEGLFDSPLYKVCSVCNTEYPNTGDFFVKDKKCRDGLTGICRECGNRRSKKWKEDNRELYLEQRRKAYDERYRDVWKARVQRLKELQPIIYRAGSMGREIKIRSRKEGIPCNTNLFSIESLTVLFAETPVCPCCNREIDYGYKTQVRDNSPSIDRIIPAIGYVEGNIALICWRCNNLKRDATIEELEKVVKWLKRTLRKTENRERVSKEDRKTARERLKKQREFEKIERQGQQKLPMTVEEAWEVLNRARVASGNPPIDPEKQSEMLVHKEES